MRDAGLLYIFPQFLQAKLSSAGSGSEEESEDNKMHFVKLLVTVAACSYVRFSLLTEA